MEIARRTEVHSQLLRLVETLDPPEGNRSEALRYELARVIDNHLFDVHRRANRAPSDAVGNPPPAVTALRAALRSVCLGEPAAAVRDHLAAHERSCPFAPD